MPRRHVPFLTVKGRTYRGSAVHVTPNDWNSAVELFVWIALHKHT